jgi:hypothetical protein
MLRYRVPAIIAAVLLLVAGSAWYFWPRLAPAPVPPPAVEAPPPASPAIAHPVAPENGGEPLPAIASADAPLAAALKALPGGKGLPALLRPELLLRHFVATVDNLPRHHLTVEQRPLKPASGNYAVAGNELAGTPDDVRNAGRYAQALAVLESLDPKDLYALYRHWYPLLQQAYQDLGYPEGYFNDRMVAAIDDLLAAPQPDTRPALARPNVMWQYADESLEARSAGQRLMLRLPPDQARRLRDRLAALRPLLVADPRPTAAN